MIDPEDTTADEREYAAEAGMTVEQFREVRMAARVWSENRSWWRVFSTASAALNSSSFRRRQHG